MGKTKEKILKKVEPAKEVVKHVFLPQPTKSCTEPWRIQVTGILSVLQFFCSISVIVSGCYISGGIQLVSSLVVIIMEVPLCLVHLCKNKIDKTIEKTIEEHGSNDEEAVRAWLQEMRGKDSCLVFKTCFYTILSVAPIVAGCTTVFLVIGVLSGVTTSILYAITVMEIRIMTPSIASKIATRALERAALVRAV